MNPTLKLCGLHLAANALLLWLGYEWLSVGESTGARLAFSAVDALAILALACWLYGATLVFFGPAEGKLKDAFWTALRHLAPLLVAAIGVIAVYGVIVWLAAGIGQPAFRVASWLTMHLRKPVRPATVLRVFEAAIWLVRWVLLPVGLLPMLHGIAVRGWGGFGDFTWKTGLRYWVTVPVLLLAGVMLPGLLLAWAPRGSFALELVSFSLRTLVAYLLFVGSMVTLAERTASARVRHGAGRKPAPLHG
ncbi:MAG TPA: hypothetical protein VMS37_27935 [Verrucomicrobiae bacterium]|nr:hypothetical protein [Verrucomicrobiae bacterium]